MNLQDFSKQLRSRSRRQRASQRILARAQYRNFPYFALNDSAGRVGHIGPIRSRRAVLRKCWVEIASRLAESSNFCDAWLTPTPSGAVLRTASPSVTPTWSPSATRNSPLRPCVAPKTPARSRAARMMAALITTWAPAFSPAAGAHRTRTDAEKASRRRPGLLRPTRYQQRPHRSDQRTRRTPPGLRSGLSQPRQLHRPITIRNRRLRNPTTPSIMKGLIDVGHSRPRRCAVVAGSSVEYFVA